MAVQGQDQGPEPGRDRPGGIDGAAEPIEPAPVDSISNRLVMAAAYRA